MKGILKFAALLALLGLFGLFCLGALGMFIAVPVVTLSETIGATHQPIVAHSASSFGEKLGLLVFIGMLLVAALLALAISRRRPGTSPDETELVYALARRAEDLTQRMEALETLLTNEPARHHIPGGPRS